MVINSLVEAASWWAVRNCQKLLSALSSVPTCGARVARLSPGELEEETRVATQPPIPLVPSQALQISRHCGVARPGEKSKPLRLLLWKKPVAPSLLRDLVHRSRLQALSWEGLALPTDTASSLNTGQISGVRSERAACSKEPTQSSSCHYGNSQVHICAHTLCGVCARVIR